MLQSVHAGIILVASLPSILSPPPHSPSPPDLPILRVQLLLNQYTAALLSGSAHPSSPPALPETQEIVNSLVDGPLSNPRGYGNMVIVRSVGCLGTVCGHVIIMCDCHVITYVSMVCSCLVIEHPSSGMK